MSKCAKLIIHMWLFITIIACFLLAIVNILDKFIVTKTVKPSVFVFYSTIISLPVFLLVPFGVEFLHNGLDWGVAVFSGISFGIGLWFMYKSFATSEISHVGPLGGAAISIWVVILGSILLHEVFAPQQWIGWVLLVGGSLLISFEQSKKHHGWHRGILWAIIAGLFFAISNVSAKYIYDEYGFYSGFVWTRGFSGITGLVLLCTPTILSALHKKNKDTSPKKNNLLLITSNKVLGGIGVLLIQYAVALSSVSLVNALTGVQYAFLIILIALFSKFRPKILKEVYTRSEIIQEIGAVCLIGLGILFLV